MNIAVDMDDVVVEFFGYVLECVAREYGPLGFTLDDITHWDDNPLKASRMFADGGTWWDWLKGRDWLWAKCPAVPGAIGGLQTLRDRGHRIELLTSKPAWAEWVVWAWAGKWRPPVHSITISGLGQSKHDASSSDLLIDDALHNVKPWLAAGRAAILFDRPWNRSEDPPGLVCRANTWKDILEVVL